jgi:hypothetical protein
MAGTISRRSALGVMGAGGLAGVLVGQVESAVAPAASGAAAPAPIEVGARFGRWTVTAIHPIEDGALRIGCKGEDEREFFLEVLARDPSPLAPPPPATTEGLAIYVSNGGDGWLPTEEEQGLAAMTLAHVLSSQGRGGAIGALLTQAERVVAHHEKLMGLGQDVPSLDQQV